jgi:hypothetical protein
MYTLMRQLPWSSLALQLPVLGSSMLISQLLYTVRIYGDSVAVGTRERNQGGARRHAVPMTVPMAAQPYPGPSGAYVAVDSIVTQ